MSDGPLYTALTSMLAQLADCEPFVARIAEFGTTKPNEPETHIYLDEAIAAEEVYSNTMNDLRPFVAIHEQGDGLQQISQGAGVGLVASGGQLILLFTDMSRPEGATANESKLEFVRWVSAIIRWFEEHNGTGDYLVPWSSIQQIDSYVRSEFKDRDEKSQDFWTVTYAFAYGVPNT